MDRIRNFAFIVIGALVLYLAICLIFALISGIYQVLRRKKQFSLAFKNTFIWFFLEIFNPFNYF